MSKEFNVPPVVFPAGGNPGPAAVAQRRLPTAPFQPPRPANPSIPFMSFDVGSAAAATSFPAPQFGGNTIGIGSNFDDEPPLLEELGINTKQIWNKTVSILNPFRVNPNLHEDADLSGPFLFLMSFGLFQLLAGKIHFGIILGWVIVAAFVLICGVQHVGWEEWEFGSLQVFEFDWVLYAATGDFIGVFLVCSPRWAGDFRDGGGFCAMVHEGLHQAPGGVGILWR